MSAAARHLRPAIAHAARVGGARDRLTLRYLARRDCEFTEWNTVCDAVRRVARFSFETGSVLRHDS